MPTPPYPLELARFSGGALYKNSVLDIFSIPFYSPSMSRLQRQGKRVKGDKPLSRQDAIEQGAVRYFTGTPCKNGHRAERYTLNGACVTCQREFVERQKDAIRKARAAAG